MVAYSYKGRFVAPIRVGLGLPVLDLHYELGGYLPGQPIRPKRQTIRANGRRRHARPGETIQQYYAMRTTKCFKIGDARCSAVRPIKIFVATGKVIIANETICHPRGLDEFARRDGFNDWTDMQDFWREEHGGELTRLGPFVGVLVEWVPL